MGRHFMGRNRQQLNMRFLTFLLILFPTALFATDYVNGTVLLTDANKPVYMANSGTGTNVFTASMSGTSGDKFKFCASLVKAQCSKTVLAGSSTGCTDPCMINMQRNWGVQYYMYEEVNSSGASLSPRKVSTWETAPQVTLACASSWSLPIEMIGQDMYTQCVNVTVTSPPSSGVVMEFRVNNAGLKTLPYDGKISVQINGGSWIPITNSAITVIDENKWYGWYPGSQTISPLYKEQIIGGPIDTFRATIPVPNSLLVNGTNTVNFRFNGTDGITSGYRILEVHFLDTATQVSMTQIVVSSNVATSTTSSAHGFSSSEDVFLWDAPGMTALFNGSRNISSVGSGTTFSFTPCGSGAGFYAIPGACTSPNGTYVLQTTQAISGELTYWAGFSQPTMYVLHQLDPQTQYTYTDPSTFTAPGSGNVSNGLTCWQTCTLALPNSPFLNNTSLAHCADCHTATGSDLSYFRYSNQALEQRTLFHGLTWQNALDITAYIRSLDAAEAVTNYARPWNPIQQPGPGIDSAAINTWDAGCGIDCQLTYDSDLYPFLSASSWANIAPTARISMTNTPIMYQLVSWNHMLPAIWPDDFFGTSYDYSGQPQFSTFITTPSGIGFRNSFMYKYYSGLASAFSGTPSNATYSGADGFGLYKDTYFFNQVHLVDIIQATGCGTNCAYDYSDGNNAAPAYGPQSPFLLARTSFSQYNLVKWFELLHDTGYEGQGSYKYTTNYGSSPEGYYARQWTDHIGIFAAAPHQQGPSEFYTNYASPSNVVAAATDSPAWDYVTNQLYYWAAINDCGNRQAQPTDPIDWNYYPNFSYSIGRYRPNAYHLALTWINATQCGWDAAQTAQQQFGDTAPTLYAPLRFGYYGGSFLAASSFKFMNSTQMTEIMNQLASNALTLLNTYTAAQFQALNSAVGNVACSLATGYGGSLNNPDNEEGLYTGCNTFRWVLPIWRYYGVNSTTTSNIITKLTAIYPGHNFTNDYNASCTSQTVGSGNLQYPLCTYP